MNGHADPLRPADDPPLGIHRGRELEAELRTNMKLIKLLETRTSELPLVDEAGNSPCTFAARLYDQNDELKKQLHQVSVQLQDTLDWLDEQVARWRGILLRVAEDRRRLKTPAAHQHYDEAEQLAQARYRQTLNERDAVRDTLQRAHAAGRAAAARRHPTHDSGAHVPFVPPGPAPSGPDVPRHSPDVLPEPPPLVWSPEARGNVPGRE